MEGAAEGDSGSRLNEIPRSQLRARASPVSNGFIKRRGRRPARTGKPDNFIETVKLLWGPVVINLISLHYPYLYSLGV